MPTRRDFFKTAAAIAPLVARGSVSSKKKSCIFLMLVGGPSQLDTWDPKPDAPSHIRSPYRPIKTNVAGIEISELFPRMARHADKYALIRSCYHDGEPVHEIGQQLVQTGHVFEDDAGHPHIGCVVAAEAPQNRGGASFSLRGALAPPCYILPSPIGNTGCGHLAHGQTRGYLSIDHNPRIVRPASYNPKYGPTRFGQSVAQAFQLISTGQARFVTVNMFDTVFGEPTWDMHGSAPFSPMSAYRDHVGPMFDIAYSALLEDLHNSGCLDDTLVVATGEFGRKPRINPAGGRDHWPECWTMLMAGGGVQGGQVVGESDRHAAEPRDRPVHATEIVASVYHALGVDHTKWLSPGTRPVMELFG